MDGGIHIGDTQRTTCFHDKYLMEYFRTVLRLHECWSARVVFGKFSLSGGLSTSIQRCYDDANRDLKTDEMLTIGVIL